MKVKILDKQDGSFKGRTDENVEYYWYKAIRLDNDVNIRFGSRNGEWEVGQSADILIEKHEKPNGEFMYKEVI